MALRDVSFRVGDGEFVSIVGPNGAGKTTLVNVVTGLLRPTEGEVRFLGRDIAGVGPVELSRRGMSRAFQLVNIFPALTVRENIMFPLHVEGLDAQTNAERVARVARMLQLEPVLDRLPNQISEGEKQRVAVARALVNRPKLILADEPTAALDKDASRIVVNLLKELTTQEGCTVVMVTHDPKAAGYADRVIFLADGRIAETLEGATADEVAEQLAHLGD